jgi:hypothetical protein
VQEGKARGRGRRSMVRRYRSSIFCLWGCCCLGGMGVRSCVVG